MESDKIYQILSQGTAKEKLSFLQQLPENTMKDAAKTLVNSSNPISSLMAYGSMLPSYCHGSACETGKALALALYRYGKELYLSDNYPDLYLMTVVGYACSHITALINLGEYEEADNFMEEEMPFWEKYEQNPGSLDANDRASFFNNFKSILVAKIDVLMHLNRIDEAWELAFNNNPRVEGNWSSDIELHRLRINLKQVKTDVGTLDKDSDQRRADSSDDQKSGTEKMLEALGKMMETSGMDPGMLDQLKQSPNVDPYTRKGFEQLEDVLVRGESFLQKNTSEDNELTVRQNIRRASGIFVDNQPSKDQILNSLDVLKQSLQSALRLKNTVLINDAYYGLYLCYSRLNRSSEAADQLISIRKNLEITRKGIASPLERGGVFQVYPYLFYSLVEHLYKVQRKDEMLDAIEGSKGRAIIDTLESESKIGVQDFNLYDIREALQPHLLKENAHYISYHVDDDCSYASIITKKGEILSYQIPIGKDKLSAWYKRNLNNPIIWENGYKKIDIISALYPFISCLEDMFDKGLISKNDHICYSADHLLYIFPIHFLKVHGTPLIELCTVSRIHSAGHLVNLLSKPVSRPTNCLAVEVPSTEDIGKPEVKQLFGETSSLLNELFTSKYKHLHHSEASLENILSNIEKNQLVHFSTHGFFPLNDNPFNNSGLLVADNNNLPALYLFDPNYKYKDEGMHLQSPERLLTWRGESNFEGCHISLQACVSGYAREGIGGDALGIEWAFLQKGAGSLISTFWNIDIKNANEFYKYFYQYWLNDELTRAAAHKKAVLKLKNSSLESDLPEEYFWAGYGLIGDWR